MATAGKKRRPQGRSKASAQYLHAKRRAQERYGLILGKESYQRLCADIQAGRGICLGKQTNRLTVWRLTFTVPVYEDMTDDPKLESLTVHVVYDKTRKTIVTFLPPGITDARGVAL